ncbi:MAG: hypothetical protein AB7Q04_13000 [Steroidobacteraceae bacterium]
MTAVEIIAAFDDAVGAIWGENMRRMWPHPKDKMMADRWLEAGLTVAQAKRVFTEFLEKRKGRQQSIPSCLSYFDNMMRDAIATEKAPVEEDAETVRWRSRVQGWKKNPKLWLADQWGEAPDSPMTRVPRRVLAGIADL